MQLPSLYVVAIGFLSLVLLKSSKAKYNGFKTKNDMYLRGQDRSLKK